MEGWRIFRPLSWMGDRMRRTAILNFDFEKVFEIGLNYKDHNKIWYLDPPYFKTEGYENPFPWENYIKLNECLKRLPESDYFILSLNQLEEYKEVFDWCNFEEIETRYTFAQGDSKNKGNLQAKEFLITPPWKPTKKKTVLDKYMQIKEREKWDY